MKAIITALFFFFCVLYQGQCLARDDTSGLAEQYISITGLHKLACILVSDDNRVASALLGKFRIVSSATRRSEDGRDTEIKSIEIDVFNNDAPLRPLRKISVQLQSEKLESTMIMTRDSTFIDHLLSWRWHDLPGEIIFLRPDVPKDFGDDLSSDVIKVPDQCIGLLPATIANRKRYKMWFSATVLTHDMSSEITSELKVANPLWALVLRMLLINHGRYDLIRSLDEAESQLTYHAALVLGLLADQRADQALPMLQNLMTTIKLADSLALGAMCSSIKHKNGTLSWYECGFVGRKSSARIKDWQLQAPSLKICPPYFFALQLSILQRPRQNTNSGQWAPRVFKEMNLWDR